jgi:hypothetical protein
MANYRYLSFENSMGRLDSRQIVTNYEPRMILASKCWWTRALSS